MRRVRILAMSLLAVLVLVVGMGAVACGGNGGESGAPPSEDGNGTTPSEDGNGTPPGDENGAPAEEIEMTLTSAAFEDGGTIPADYTCDGQDISPELSWSGAPEGTQSFALIVDDPDSPSGDFTHWIIFNIPADTSTLVTSVSTAALSVVVWEGENDFGSIGYRGPCPPSGQTHHYRFTIYALDTMLELSSGAARSQLLEAMEGHLLGQAELVAIFQH